MASQASGGAGLSCTGCHTTVAHRVAGRGVDMRERDLPGVTVACANCHQSTPHSDSTLNRHTARVDCNVCHVPVFAKSAPTDMRRDWSMPGDLNPATGLFEPHMTLENNVSPVYKFFNGKSQFYEFGTPATPGPNGRVLMAGPLGSINDVGAKITALKRHEGLQPIDPISKRLLPLKIGIFFQTGDVATAVAQGAAGVGWPYTGYEFAETERYMGVYHEVAPEGAGAGLLELPRRHAHELRRTRLHAARHQEREAAVLVVPRAEDGYLHADSPEARDRQASGLPQLPHVLEGAVRADGKDVGRRQSAAAGSCWRAAGLLVQGVGPIR